VLLTTLLAILQLICNQVLSFSDPFPRAASLDILPRCLKPGCTTLLYAPSDVLWVRQLMQEVARRQSLEFGVDVVAVSVQGGDSTVPRPFNLCLCENTSCASWTPLDGSDAEAACAAGGLLLCRPCAAAADASALRERFLTLPGATQNAVQFVSAYLPLPAQLGAFTNATVVSYNLHLNSTESAWPLRRRSFAPETKRALDEAALALLSGSPSASLLAQQRPFPVPRSRLAGVDLAGAEGAVFFCLPPMLLCFHMLTELVSEKQRRVRLALAAAGATRAAYFTAWGMHALALAALSASTQLASGAILGFDVFRRASPPAVWLIFFLFSFAMAALGAAASALTTTSEQAQSLGYSAILTGVTFQILLSTGFGGTIEALTQRRAGLPRWFLCARALARLWPPFHFAKAYDDVASLASRRIDFQVATVDQGPGYKWADVRARRSPRPFGGDPVDVPTTANALGWMAGLTVAYSALAFYLDAVVPDATTGAKAHPLALLHPATWGMPVPVRPLLTSRGQLWDCFQSWAGGRDDGMQTFVVAAQRGAPGETAASEGVGVAAAAASASQGSDEAVRVSGLWKVYGPGVLTRAWRALLRSVATAYRGEESASADDARACVFALQDVSLVARCGMLLTLLGENGSGKSTLLGALAGTLTPSSGAATLRPPDDPARSLCGVCPQHDTLWEQLSCAEHVRLFAALKGVSFALLEDEVVQRLTDVSLLRSADTHAGALSGGMRRRLSLALACTGSPAVLLLDEPSAGLDPVARRKMWSSLERLKRRGQCAIVVATHDVTEAEHISDEVALLSSGRLRAFGTPLALRVALGGGARVRITGGTGASDAAQALCVAVPGATVEACDVSGATVRVPPRSELLPPALRTLEEAQAAGRVACWAVSDATMEDVILRITREATPQESDDELDSEHEDDAATSSLLPEDSLVRAARHPAPFAALMLKNLLLLRQGGSGLVWLLLAPAAVCLLLRGMQGGLASALGDLAQPRLLEPPPWPLNNNLAFPSDPHPKAHNGSDCTEFFLFAEGPGLARGAVGTLPPWPSSTARGLLGAMPRRSCTMLAPLPGQQSSTGGVPEFEVPLLAPYFLRRNSEADMASELFSLLDGLSSTPIRDIERGASSNLPDGTVAFAALDPFAPSMSYTFSVNDAVFFSYHRQNNFTRLDARAAGGEMANLGLGRVLLLEEAALALMSMLHTALRDSLFGRTQLLLPPELARLLPPNAATLLSHGFAQRMPGFVSVDAGGIVQLLGGFMFPLVLALPLPRFLDALVAEKEGGMLALQRAHGLSPAVHLLATSIFFLGQYAAVAGTLGLFGWLCGQYLFSRTALTVLVPLLAACGVACVGAAFFLSSALRSRRAATVVGYAVALFGTMVCVAVAQGIYGDIPALSLPLAMPRLLFAIPPLAAARALYALNFACSAKHECITRWADAPSDVGAATTALFLTGFLMMALFLALEGGLLSAAQRALQRTQKQRRGCESLAEAQQPGEGDAPSAGGEQRQGASCPPGHPAFELHVEVEPDAELDGCSSDHDSGDEAAEDVRAERRAAARADVSTAPLLTRALRKVYPGASTAALHGLWLAPASGCLGLLGPNGAGKSTLLALLTGATAPTGGAAWVAGTPVGQRAAAAALGLCTQGNTVWGELTVEEHLLFWSRLRGSKAGASVASDARVAARAMGLTAKLHARANTLSGGMIRRLCLAAATVGAPQLLLLDEPSAGLDVATRKRVWRALIAARDAPAAPLMILTTHAMDEAALLSTRVAILASGALQAVGTADELRSRHAGHGGHTLQVSLSQDGEERPEHAATHAAISQLFPGATLLHAGGLGRTYRLSAQSGGAAEVFEVLQKSALPGVADWGLSQAGLDDVFFAVVAQAKTLVGRLPQPDE